MPKDPKTEPQFQQALELLSDALDLTIRAQRLNDPLEALSAADPTNPAGYDIIRPRSKTPHLWVLAQYDHDLAEWQERAKALLIRCGHG